MIDISSVKNWLIRMAISGELTQRPTTALEIKQLLESIHGEYLNLLKNGETKKIKEAPMIKEGLFNIPESWEWVPLGQLCVFLSRGKSPKYSSEKLYPVFAQKCNQPNGLALEKAKFLDKGTLDKWAPYFRLQEQDVLINSTGTGTMGRVGFYITDSLDDKFPFMLPDSHVTVVRFGTGVIPKYVFYVLRSVPIQAIMERQFKGTTNQKEFYIESVYSIPIPLPSTSEQNEIVSKLDEALKQLDCIDASQRKYQTDFDVLKRKIIDAGIRGELTEQLPEDGTAEELYQQIQAEKASLVKEGKIKKSKPLPEITEDEIPFEIPNTWKWVRLEDVYEINPKVEADDDLDAAFVPMERISAGFSSDFTYEIQSWAKASKNHTRFVNNDVAFAKISPCFENRKSFIAKDLPNGIGGGTTELIILRQKIILPEYTYYLLLDQRFINTGSGQYKGVVGQQRVKANIVREYLIPLPPFAEQKRIVERIEELLAAMPK